MPPADASSVLRATQALQWPGCWFDCRTASFSAPAVTTPALVLPTFPRCKSFARALHFGARRDELNPDGDLASAGGHGLHFERFRMACSTRTGEGA